MTRQIYLTAARLRDLRQRLTPLEWEVLRSAEGIGLATAGQLARVHCTAFPEAGRARQCRRLLARLARADLLLRLPRTPGGRGGGSEPFIYRLGPAGQALLGHERRRLTLPSPMYLDHTLGIAESWARLMEADRAGHVELLEFTREPRCWERYSGLQGERWLKPDARVRFARGGWEFLLALEIDRASEGPSAIRRKLDGYIEHRTLAPATTVHPHPLVLFVVPDEARHDWMMKQLARLPAEHWAQFLVTTEADFTSCLTRLS